MNEKKGFSVQLKPVGASCNLDCVYCYMAPFHSQKFEVMSYDILEKLISATLTNNKKVCFSWHGGEPILAGLDFFQKAVELISHYKTPKQLIAHVIQTNATTITKDFAKFFKQHNFSVGISLDGPQKIHDLHRTYNNKSGSFKKVMEGISLLKEEGVQMSVIVTVTKDSLSYCKEVFDFIIEQGFKIIKYNPVFDNQDFVYSIGNDEWFNYLKQVLDMWINLGDSKISIREIEEILEWINKKTFNLCSGDESCLQWISIDPNGNLYPCEYLRTSISYGNIRDVDLATIRQTVQYKKFLDLFLNVPQTCKDCKCYLLCRNGCPANRQKDGHITFDGQYVYCESKKKLYEELKTILS